jgi:hypothetical protein
MKSYEILVTINLKSLAYVFMYCQGCFYYATTELSSYNTARGFIILLPTEMCADPRCRTEGNMIQKNTKQSVG